MIDHSGSGIPTGYTVKCNPGGKDKKWIGVRSMNSESEYRIPILLSGIPPKRVAGSVQNDWRMDCIANAPRVSERGFGQAVNFRLKITAVSSG
jgi:hypothetical protein